jgi:hypothetical protein
LFVTIHSSRGAKGAVVIKYHFSHAKKVKEVMGRTVANIVVDVHTEDDLITLLDPSFEFQAKIFQEFFSWAHMQ